MGKGQPAPFLPKTEAIPEYEKTYVINGIAYKYHTNHADPKTGTWAKLYNDEIENNTPVIDAIGPSKNDPTYAYVIHDASGKPAEKIELSKINTPVPPPIANTSTTTNAPVINPNLNPEYSNVLNNKKSPSGTNPTNVKTANVNPTNVKTANVKPISNQSTKPVTTAPVPQVQQEPDDEQWPIDTSGNFAQPTRAPITRRDRPAQQTKLNPEPSQDSPRIGWNDMNENTMLERMLQLAKRNIKLDEAGELTSDIYRIPSGPDRQAAAAEQEKINKGQLPNSSVLATLRTKYNYSPKNYSVTPNSGNINYGPTAPVKEFPEIPANDQEGLSIVKPYVTTFKTTGNVNVVPQHAALIKNKYGVDIAQRLKNPVQAAPTGSAKTVPTPGTVPQNTINQTPKQAADVLGAKKFESTTYREDPILARIVELSRAK